MRKSNIDNLWSLGFMRICMANFLLFASLYMLFPVLPAVMVSRLGISTVQVGSMFLVFAVGMFLVGHFMHIWEMRISESTCLSTPHL